MSFRYMRLKSEQFAMWKELQALRARQHVDTELAELQRDVLSTAREVTGQELYTACNRSEIGISMQELPLDSRYKILPMETWWRFLRWSGVNNLKYVPDFLDCDDFAFILKAECHRELQVNGIGLVIDFSGQHAYNCIGVDEGSGKIGIATIEPQNDQLIVTYESMYDAESGLIIF